MTSALLSLIEAGPAMRVSLPSLSQGGGHVTMVSFLSVSMWAETWCPIWSGGRAAWQWAGLVWPGLEPGPGPGPGLGLELS